MEPWEVVNSKGGGPYAVRTLLGLVITRPLRGGNVTRSSCPTVTANQISIANKEELLLKQYNHDLNEKSTEDKPETSRVYLKVLKIMSSSVEINNGHYCMRLPLKVDNFTMTNNRHVAEQKALCLERTGRRR